jgi:CO/xanthine dehydrogenase Mo-binding subunit
MLQGATSMRYKFNPQLNIFTTMARNQIAKELQQMSKVLDATPR